MKKIFLGFAVGLLLLSLSGCSLLKQRFGDNFYSLSSTNYAITAKQWFPYVLDKAVRWQTDAQFYGIPETKVNLKGESESWSYLFSSAESSKQIVIKVQSGFISQDKNTINVLPPITKWEIDSVGAVFAAEKYGAADFIKKNSSSQLVMSLFGKIPATNSKKPVWILRYYGTSSVYVIAIDANTGGKIDLPVKFY